MKETQEELLCMFIHTYSVIYSIRTEKLQKEKWILFLLPKKVYNITIYLY